MKAVALERFETTIERGDDGVPAVNRQGAPRKKVVLYVDNDERIARTYAESTHGSGGCVQCSAV
jgi:hypothetical protein